MLYIYLIYGVTFFILGGAMTLQSLSAIRVLPRRAGLSLAAFGFLHGSFEFVAMLQFMESAGISDSMPVLLDYLSVLLLPSSFLCLLLFAIELLIEQKKWPGKSRRIYIALLSIFALGIWASGYATSSISSGANHWLEIYSRYFVALPASMVAAYATWSFANHFEDIRRAHLTSVFKMTSWAFVLYGVAAGILMTQQSNNSFWPEHHVSFAPFVIAIRASVALGLTVLLSDAFFIEVSYAKDSLQKMREEFNSVLAHDLRNIAGQIQNSSELLRKVQNDNDKNDRSVLLGILCRSSKTLNRLISDMFDVSLIDLDRLELKKETGDLRQVVSEICDQNRPNLGDRKLIVQIPTEPVPAIFDSDRLSQILMNLLSNAAKYSYPRSDIEVRMTPNGDDIQLSATSLGRPLSKVEQSRLFSKFYRAQSSCNEANGTGLGLHIVKGLVEAHGGKVNVASDSSGRTTFGFSLPALPMKDRWEPSITRKTFARTNMTES